jgi:hypothetical protein
VSKDRLLQLLNEHETQKGEDYGTRIFENDLRRAALASIKLQRRQDLQIGVPVAASFSMSVAALAFLLVVAPIRGVVSLLRSWKLRRLGR